MVTTSPDVSISTGLGGFINRKGVFAPEVERDYEPEEGAPLVWRPSPQGQHLELGISEMNLFGLLGQLGLGAELHDVQLLPIGTVYDPFVCRGLDALVYAAYNGARFVFAGTPSGVSLSREGGAHQSSITPSIGAELPGLRFYEPCYALEVEWVLLDALRRVCDVDGGEASLPAPLDDARRPGRADRARRARRPRGGARGRARRRLPARRAAGRPRPLARRDRVERRARARGARGARPAGRGGHRRERPQRDVERPRLPRARAGLRRRRGPLRGARAAGGARARRS